MNRKWLAWAALPAVSCAAVLAGVQPAAATDVSFATTCIPPKVPGVTTVHGTSIAGITATGTSPKVGDTVKVSWKFVQVAAKNPPKIFNLPANSVKPSGTIAVAGAQQETLHLSGPMVNPPIPMGATMVLSTMTGTLKLTKAGTVTLRPLGYVVTALGTDTVCTSDKAAPIALTLTVAAGSGGTSTTGSTTSGTTGSTSSGTTGSTTSGSSSTSGGSSSGGLASTGGDADSVRALGLLGGTILLVGAAVFALTPWRRLRRER